MRALAHGASLCIAFLLCAASARADDETRLLPPALSLSDPGPTARIGHAWLPNVSLRFGYGQRSAKEGGKAQYGDALLGLGFGLFHRLELSTYFSVRYLDPPLPQPVAVDPLQLQVKVALRVLPAEGSGSGVALYGGARVPLGMTDEDPRVGVRFGLIGDERLSFGLRISMFAGAELRFAEGERRFTALADLGIGFSIEIWRRIQLQLFAAGNARMSLTDLPASTVNFPVTGTIGFAAAVAPAVNLEIGAYYDHTRPAGGADARAGMGFGFYLRLAYKPEKQPAKDDSQHQESAERAAEARRVKPAAAHLLATPAPKDCDLSQKGRDATVAVVRANDLYLGPALAQRGMEAIEEVVRGTAMAMAVTATLVGATLYFQASMELTILFLQWLGVGSMSMLAVERAAVVGGAFDQFIGTIAIACGDPSKIDRAAQQYADAVALVTGAAAETLFFLAAAKGLDPVLKQLEGSKLHERLGASRLRNWLAEGVRRIKGQNKPAAASARNPDPPARIVETAAPKATAAGKTKTKKPPKASWNTPEGREQRYADHIKRNGPRALSREAWEKRHGNRPPPSPRGSRGTPKHEATVLQLVALAEKEYPGEQYRIQREKSILKQSEPPLRRTPDVSVVDKTTNRVVKVYEAGRGEKSGRPVKYERIKEAEYNARGILYEFVTVEE